MRTLALLAALVLVTLQAQAGPLQEREEEIPALELPGAQDRDLSISIIWNENSILESPGNLVSCSCRRAFCNLGERHIGTCFLRDNIYSFCCT
uniref:Mammalian defensins domain-containing protein n=1 Tax=Prolemur simus TaxID=1328070 RepID=A0A8C8ZMH1_PROSS